MAQTTIVLHVCTSRKTTTRNDSMKAVTMLIRAAIDDYLLMKTACGLRLSSLIIYRRCLSRFAASLTIRDLRLVTPSVVSRYIAERLTLGVKGTTMVNQRALIIDLLQREVERGNIQDQKWDKAVPPLHTDQTETRALSPELMGRVVSVLEVMRNRTGMIRRRNKAIVYVLLDTGLRSAELLGLTLADMDMAGLAINIRSELAKNRMARTVYFSVETLKTLQNYLRVRHGDCPWLWVAQGNKSAGMSRRALGHLLKRIGNAVGADWLSPHKLRHTFASACLHNGMGVVALQRLLGHSRLSTTMRYVHLNTEWIAAEHAKASPVARLLR